MLKLTLTNKIDFTVSNFIVKCSNISIESYICIFKFYLIHFNVVEITKYLAKP